ncbi:hypothetical protein [Thermococcus sp. 21S7]|uniref:hypothetical protein n=1 Tax=Thermococcus sp. 21S7 TaxID=1638221 RepID=UPI00143B6B6D|nr:hypothetical protein [Thermococcus sp. 21S7]NJE60466.1 hypothetical protein [Thermococcus sp. 21S7]
MGFFREALLGILFIFFIIFVFSVVSMVLSAMYPDIIAPAQQDSTFGGIVQQFIALWNRTPLVLIFGAFIAMLVAAFYAESQQRRVM